MYAETMLLIDNDQHQVVIGDLLLKECVRADNDVDSAIPQTFEDIFTLAAFFTSSEECRTQPCPIR